MARITWNKTTQTYTVSHTAPNGEKCIVRGIAAKSQADCVAIELRNDLPVSFGTCA